MRTLVVSMEMQLFHYLTLFFGHTVAFRILVSQPGLKPMVPALGVWGLNQWTTRAVPEVPYFRMPQMKRR